MSDTASLYVYGSVATGMARHGRSDVDLVTIGLDPGTARSWAQTLTMEFSSLCRAVEIGAAQPVDYEGDSDEAHGNRVFLRHYCVHLTGPNRRRELPDCLADRAAARGFNGDLAIRVAQWREALDAGTDPAKLARRIGRKTLFAVAGLVSIHDAGWTTDRLTAAKRFGALRPALAASLNTMFAWGNGDGLPTSRREVDALLDGAITAVVDEFESRIGLWRPAGSAPIA